MLTAALRHGPVQPARAPACPREAKYSREFQKAAAEELLALPLSSSLAQMIVDYGKLRDQARVCRGEPK